MEHTYLGYHTIAITQNLARGLLKLTGTIALCIREMTLLLAYLQLHHRITYSNLQLIYFNMWDSGLPKYHAELHDSYLDSVRLLLLEAGTRTEVTVVAHLGRYKVAGFVNS